MVGVSPVNLEEQCHKFVQSLEYTPFGCIDDEHEVIDQLLRELLTHLFSPLHVVLPPLAYLKIHRAITCLFPPPTHCDDDEEIF